MIVTPGPGRVPGRAQLATTASGVLAFGLGVAGLALTRHVDGPATASGPPVDAPLGPLDLAYRGLQLFVLDGGALDGMTDLHPVLQIARFAAPAVTVTALLLGLRLLLANELGRWRISRMRDHAVVCGDGREAAALARNLCHDEPGRRRPRGVLVTATRSAAPAGVPTVLGDPRDREVLRAAGVGRARAVYALADSSASSTAVAIAAGGVPRECPGRLETYAQVRSDNLVEGLRLRRLAGGAGPGTTVIDFFVVADVAARALLAAHPPGDDPAVVGTGELAAAVVRRIERARPDGAAVRRHEDAATADRRLPGGQRPVYVCLPDDDADEAVATALRLAASPDRRVVLCLNRAAPFADALGTGGPLSVFGVLDTGWTPEAIAGDTVVGRTARAIHEGYRSAALARGETPETNRSAVPWHDLEPYLRASNAAQAEDIGDKLTAIGVRLGYEPDPGAFAFTDGEIERLAHDEHDRWCSERRAAGFRYGPERTATTHPDLRGWDDLDELAREKDRDAVRALPRLLAGEGLHLRRGGPS